MPFKCHAVIDLLIQTFLFLILSTEGHCITVCTTVSLLQGSYSRHMRCPKGIFLNLISSLLNLLVSHTNIAISSHIYNIEHCQDMPKVIFNLSC